MDIKGRLLLSVESKLHICCFRERASFFVYQGAVLWAQTQGIQFKLDCSAPRTRYGTRVLHGKINADDLLLKLQRSGKTYTKTDWGILVELPSERCFVKEAEWVEGCLKNLPADLWLKEKKGSKAAVDNLAMEVLDELVSWPVGDLSPVRAVQAISRWQSRLRQMRSG